MDEPYLSDLMRVLQPALKSQKKAKELLDRFWQDKQALIWTTTHVHQAANENKTVLTEDDARSILQRFCHSHDRQYGLDWSDLVEAIRDSGLGRDIRAKEIRKLLRNILTIDPP